VAESTQLTFELRETAIALIKQQGIHEGFWMLAFQINFTVGVFGTMAEDVAPGLLARVEKVQLSKLNAQGPHPPFAVNAAEVNPAPAEAR
jgi:hypothetical protein